jgi:alginate O-acetyltransferase complex protein AlgI
LSGLWHGANWTFVLWGTYHGTFLVLNRFFKEKQVTTRLPKALNVAVTFILVTIGWALFRSRDIAQIGFYFSAMFNPASAGTFIHIGNHIMFFGSIGFVLCFIRDTDIRDLIIRSCHLTERKREIEACAACVVFLCAVGKISTLTFNPFLYFRF